MTRYKTLVVPLKCSKLDEEYLLNSFKLSAQVWNMCIEFDKKFREENDGKWIQRSDLQRACKKCVPLNAKSIQHTLHKYLYSRDATMKAIKSGRTDEKVTYRNKRYFVVGWEYQAIQVLDNCILLQKAVLNGKRQKPVKVYVKNIPENIVLVELIYREKPYLTIKYKEDAKCDQVKSDNRASIDLGEIHSITSIDTLGNAIIITGRRLREIKQMRNRHTANLRRKISKCTKYSRNYWRYRKALINLKYSTDRKINDTINKTVKLYLDFCLLNKISVLYYGNLDSATRGTKNKINKFIGQKLNQWNYGRLMECMENKLSNHGIELIKVKEYYSSQKCPSCKELNKVSNRCYCCSKCGYKQHRDIVGAINILNDNSETHITKYTTKKYLQIA